MSLIVEHLLASDDPQALVPWLADRVEAAIKDATQLVTWIAPNSVATADPQVEEAFLRALGAPVPHDLAVGVPLLLYGCVGRPATTLLDAVLNPPVPRVAHFMCDVSDSDAREQNIIWIPAGAHVVQLTVRNFVRDVMQTHAGCSLVWF